MSKIQEYLNKILSARYGKDVRQAIHDAIFQCYEDGKAGEVDLVAREGVVSLREDVTEMQEDISKVHEDIAALDSKAEAIEIKTTKENTIKGTKHGGFRLNKIVANTVQNGTPSPSTPFPLLSTGDCVELVQGSYETSTGSYNSTYAKWVANRNPIPCKSGDTVELEFDTNLSTYIYYYNENGFVSYSSNGVGTPVKNASFVVPSGATYFNYSVGNNSYNSFTPQNAGKITITINGKYLGCAKTNKNFSELQGYWEDDGTFVETQNQVSYADFIPCKPNDNIYALLYGTNATSVFLYYDNGKNFISMETVYAVSPFDKSYTSVAPTNAYYFKFYVGNAKGLTVENLRLGVVINGIPFQETIAWYTTQYPPMKGSTLFKEDGLFKMEHKNMPFSVNENSDISAWGGSYPHLFKVTLAEAKATTSDIMCSHFQTYEEVGTVFTKDMIYTINGALSVNHMASSSVSEFKAWLSNNPIYGIAPRTTPIIETLDTASQIALNGLETFDGMTIVEFDTRIPPLEFEAEVGTSQVGAYTLKSLNNSESNAVKYEKLNTMILSLGGNV